MTSGPASSPAFKVNLATDQRAVCDGPKLALDAAGSVYALFLRQLARAPDAPALLGTRALDYRALARASERTAAALQAEGVSRGDRVAIWLHDPAAAAIGCLAVWAAGAACLPIDESTPPERVRFLLEDSRARVLLTDASLRTRLGEALPAIVCSDELPATLPPLAELAELEHRPDDIAYVVYTSGSTGWPKGVAIRHCSLINFIQARSQLFGKPERVLPVHSLAFDPGIGGLAWALAEGAGVLLLDAEARRDPEALRAAIDTYNATFISGVPALYEALLRDARPGSLRSLRCCAVGGERLPPALARALYDRLPDVSVWNEYGPTEATIASTAYLVPQSGEHLDPLPIGRPFANTSCYVLDAQGRLAGIGEAGELYIGGAGVAAGYLGRKELNAERFQPDPWKDEPGARMYRTGDRARWRNDAQLEFLGRVDFQVKVRGHRLELAELEHQIVRAGVREAVVVLQPTPSGDQLAAYYSTFDGAARPELRQRLAQVLPAYMLPTWFEHLPALPLNAAGKVDRRALPAPSAPSPLPAAETAEWSDSERAVANIWCEVLSLSSVGRESDFFALGGHSLSAAMVVSRVREALGLRVPVRCLFAAPSLQAFAAALERDGQPAEAAEPEPDVAALESLPIAPLQAPFWYLAQLDPSSAAYVVQIRLSIRGGVDPERLQAALQAVVDHNEVLRTRFVPLQGAPIQVVLSKLSVPLERIDLRLYPRPHARASRLLDALMQQPFDLEQPPLLRARLLRVADSEDLLGIAVHHIVFDGWSAGLLLKQLFAAYDGKLSERGAPREQYRSHAYRARARLRGERRKALLSYFQGQLQDLPPPLSLTRDFPPTDADKPRRGALVFRKLSPELTTRMRAQCAAIGVTHFVFSLAVFKLLVARWTGAHDIAVGVPVAVRDEPRVERMIGCFVNSVVLRTQLPELSAAFLALLARVKEVTLEGLAHAELPFDWLVAELRPQREERAGNPLFRLFFNDIDRRHELPVSAGLSFTPLHEAATISKFDLTFYIHQFQHADELQLLYDPDLFSAERMQAFAAQFEQLLDQVARDATRPIGGYELRTAAARAVLPDASLQLGTQHSGGLLQDAIYASAEHTPERIAVSDGERELSYRELVLRANAIARALVEAGLAPGDRVAIYAQRSAALVSLLLGVLEAGGSFALLDSEQPRGWQESVLRALRPRGWLTLGSPPWAAELGLDVMLDAAALGGSEERVRVTRSAEDEAYVMFTSGTTGGAKGVRGSHRPVRHFLDWYLRAFRVSADDRFSMLAGLSHDPLLRDIFAPLSAGARLCVPSAEIRRQPDRLVRWLREQAISVVHLTPALGTFIAAGANDGPALSALRLLMFGGERLRNVDLASARRYAPRARVVNAYGTTETPQVAGYHELDADDASAAPPIGRGIDDTQLLVVNPLGGDAGAYELGTIHVRSAYLFDGYLTADSGDAPVSVRRYPTGDLGYYDQRGRVHYLGRADRQVNVRGYRVELSAIESTLERMSGVARAHVLAREGPDENTQLRAYVVAARGASLDPEQLRAALGSCLLDAMLPSVLRIVPELPLTSNGKVDARMLLANESPARARGNQYQEPRNQTEDMIARLWAELLELDDVGLDDDFFQLGGHSLLAVRMLSILSERLGTAVPMALLAEHSSVAGLAKALHGAGDIDEEKLVVELRNAGTLPPFWLIHPVGGHVVFARRFCALLAPEQNVFGIQAQGLDGRQPPFETIEDMARHYITLLRAHQPSGPYYFGGPSFGGKVCYEMAQQLLAAGERPELVVLFDTFAPRYPEAKALLPWLGDKLAQSFREGPWRTALRAGRRLLRITAPRGYADYLAAEGLDDSSGSALQRVIAANQKASRRYVVKPYAGTICLFRAQQKPDWPGMDFSDETNGWGRYAQHVEVEHIDSNHQQLFEEPAVRELAKKFSARHRRALAEMGAQSASHGLLPGAFVRPSELSSPCE